MVDFTRYIPPNASAEMRRRVSKALSVNPSRRPGGEVLSTPALVMLMERTAVRACQSHLPPGFTTVGYHVDIRHLAPLPVGQEVRVLATLQALEGNKLTFRVEAYGPDGKRIGEGTHRRAIIPIRER
ncbi:MAG: thioesterase family protein [Dehalococcoidia bacterium]|nr:thioesterase family protein [Dehalococcoidia bacterium]MDW8119869.1 thioesterase family protein [Chloroflexota bacterium]